MEESNKGKVIDFNPMTPQAEPQMVKVRKENPEKQMTPSEKAEKHAKMVSPEIMANIRKNEAEKAKAEAYEHMLEVFVGSFVYKWNEKNPSNMIEMRLRPTSAPVGDSQQFQFCLALELKKDGVWRVLCRVGVYAYPGDSRDMALLTLDLYQAMFVEIAHSGLLSAVALSDQSINTSYAQTQQSSKDIN